MTTSLDTPAAAPSATSLKHLNESWGFHCQKVVAHLRNEAIDALDHNDSGMVVYRYLQCRRGQRITRNNMLWSAPTVLLLPYTGVNAGNNIHFKHTKRACKQRLTDQYGPEFVAELQKIKCYSESLDKNKDFSQVLQLLQKHAINTTHFEAAASEFFWEDQAQEHPDDASASISIAATPSDALAYDLVLAPPSPEAEAPVPGASEASPPPEPTLSVATPVSAPADGPTLAIAGPSLVLAPPASVVPITVSARPLPSNPFRQAS